MPGQYIGTLHMNVGDLFSTGLNEVSPYQPQVTRLAKDITIHGPPFLAGGNPGIVQVQAPNSATWEDYQEGGVDVKVAQADVVRIRRSNFGDIRIRLPINILAPADFIVEAELGR